MDKMVLKAAQRQRRQWRVRSRVTGTAERPRLAVHRTLKHMYAQLVDDITGRTLCAASTRSAGIGELASSGNQAAASKVGELIAKLAAGQGIKKVVFDRGGCLYHGRVKALADGARQGGLEF